MGRIVLHFSLYLSVIFFITFSQTYQNDSLAVRAILDSNGLTTVTVQEVSSTDANGRIDSLGIESKNLTTLPREIGELTALRLLFLGENKLATLPAEIGNCTELYSCAINKNDLTSIPAEIGSWKKLVYLFLTDNKLTSIPDAIGELVELDYCDLQYNSLTEIPSTIGNLPKIDKLKLGGNNLTALPANIESLTSLSGLYIEGNKLTTLPAEIGTLVNLKFLWAHRNEMTQLPAQIGQCTGLISLLLSYNKLATLPDEITACTPPSLDLGYNLLDTNSLAPAIKQWADTLDPDWRLTQLISSIKPFAGSGVGSGFIVQYVPLVKQIKIRLQHPGHIRIDLYTITGRIVESLVNGYMTAGEYTVHVNTRRYGAGVYTMKSAIERRVFTEIVYLFE